MRDLERRGWVSRGHKRVSGLLEARIFAEQQDRGKPADIVTRQVFQKDDTGRISKSVPLKCTLPSGHPPVFGLSGRNRRGTLSGRLTVPY